LIATILIFADIFILLILILLLLATLSPLQMSPISEQGHSDPVMSLSWVFDPASQAYMLASLGADGKVGTVTSQGGARSTALALINVLIRVF
jgi:hypothetical protein